MTTRNYKYGLRGPTGGGEVLRQMELANRYHNRLVAIERERRAAIDAACLEADPVLASIEAAIARLDDGIASMIAERKQRSAAERRRVHSPETDARIAEAKLQRKGLRIAARQRKRSAMESAAKGPSELAAQRVRDARAASGLYWGTYLIVEQAVDAARTGPPPRYQSWRGEGRVAVQIQGGLSWERATSGTDTRLQIVPQSGYPGKFRTLRMRVGSDGRAPIWAEWPMILHRPIPADAEIMWAVVSLVRVAGKPRWSVMLTLRMPAAPYKPAASGGAVGIDVGYHVRGTGALRVACTHGSDGAGEELRLDVRDMREWARVERIQGHRDRKFHLVRRGVRWWLEHHEHAEWLDIECRHIGQWKQPRRLLGILDGLRATGDTSRLRWLLERWRRREEHLREYQENLRDQLIARRRDTYRKWADRLAKRYRTCYAERLDLRDLQKVNRPASERSDDEVHPNIRRAARIACLSLLRQCLRERMTEYVELSPEHTTTDCHACGHRSTVRRRRHVCESCGAEWDQDDNAARNLLARGEAARKDRESLAAEAQQGVSADAGEAKKPSRSERFAAARKSRRKPRETSEV